MDNRDPLLQKLENYQARHPEETEMTNRFLTFVRKNTECFQRELLSGHITASAWVLNQKGTHALLTHHRKLNRWLQLGGHADGDPDTLAVALREIHEESGLSTAPLIDEIFDLDAHTIPAYKDVPEHIHYDIRYLVQTTENDALQINHESLALRWVTAEEIPTLTQSPDILRMAQKWQAHQNEASPNDYVKFRGRCKELSEQAVAQNPSLTLVRGHYFCPIWNTEEPHWWTTEPDGKIFDPSKDQFPSRGLGIYTPFDGMVTCAQCSKRIPEEEASFESNYAFCSNLCHGRFVGVF